MASTIPDGGLVAIDLVQRDRPRLARRVVAPLAMAASGLFYFEGLKRGATYLFEIAREGIDARNGVLAVPADFGGGLDGIAYLVQDAEGRLAITVVAPGD